MIDPQRFARGMTPDREARDYVVVRRLKDKIVNEDGAPKFPGRDPRPIPVDYPTDEQEVHGWLSAYAQLRRQRLGTSKAAARAADLATLLLKKRLFSSPAAFAQTIDVHRTSMLAQAQAHRFPDDVPPYLETLFGDATLDDEALAETENDDLARSARLQMPPTPEELELLDLMERWALAHEARPDAKARALIIYLAAVCKPDGQHWTNERVVVFTEYRDTQRWLADLLQQAGLGDGHLTQLHGGMSVEEREQLREAFQASPDEHPVRILLATDAASEGIDLQRNCHRLVNYDIPFNPNKLEQRIGRIDRYLQREVAEIRHFVGSGIEHARPGSYEDHLEFLSRVAVKVARMEADLGAVNASPCGRGARPAARQAQPHLRRRPSRRNRGEAPAPHHGRRQDRPRRKQRPGPGPQAARPARQVDRSTTHRRGQPGTCRRHRARNWQPATARARHR